jgi:hypothetical protein
MTSSLLSRSVNLLSFSAAQDEILTIDRPKAKNNCGRIRHYADALAQAAQRWHVMLGMVLRKNPLFLGEEDLLALQSLAIHGHIMPGMLQGVAAMGFGTEAARSQAEVERLATDIENTAGDWNVVADSDSQRLPSRTPVALLSACLLRRCPQRSYGMLTQNPRCHSPHFPSRPNHSPPTHHSPSFSFRQLLRPALNRKLTR